MSRACRCAWSSTRRAHRTETARPWFSAKSANAFRGSNCFWADCRLQRLSGQKRRGQVAGTPARNREAHRRHERLRHPATVDGSSSKPILGSAGTGVWPRTTVPSPDTLAAFITSAAIQFGLRRLARERRLFESGSQPERGVDRRPRRVALGLRLQAGDMHHPEFCACRLGRCVLLACPALKFPCYFVPHRVPQIEGFVPVLAAVFTNKVHR